LVVEDDPAVAEGIAAALDDVTEVTVCGSAEAALERLAKTAFDVVCADYGLPGISGLDLLERLTKGGSALRGVLVTGSEEFYAVSKRRGYYVLKKPFDPERLRSVVIHLASLVSMRRSVQLLQSGTGQR
jgi:DNA-binding NtrC family response regulator